MLELEKELTTELQKISILNSAISNLEQTQQRAEKSVTALAEMPETTKMYKPIGRV